MVFSNNSTAHDEKKRIRLESIGKSAGLSE
jgi:hypothetical protein